MSVSYLPGFLFRQCSHLAQTTGNDKALAALYATWFNMNSHAGVRQPAFYVFFQVVTHQVGFFQTGILGYQQVKFDKALTSCLASAYFMETS